MSSHSGAHLLLRCGGRRRPGGSSESKAVVSVLLPESFRGGCSFGAAGGDAATVSPDTTSSFANPVDSRQTKLRHTTCRKKTLHLHQLIAIQPTGQCIRWVRHCFYSTNQIEDSPHSFVVCTRNVRRPPPKSAGQCRRAWSYGCRNPPPAHSPCRSAAPNR
jgi:hypothetical protein